MRQELDQTQPDFGNVQASENPGQDADGVASFIREAARALDDGDVEGALKAVSRGDKALEKAVPDLLENIGRAQGLALDGIRLACLVRQGELGRAEGVLAARESDEQAYIPRILAFAHALAGADRHDQACEAVSRGLALYPGSIPLHCHMAELLKVRGHILQAVRALKKAIALDPGNPGLWADLAVTCLNRFDKEAKAAAKKAVALAETPDSGRPLPPLSRLKALTAMARVESFQGRFEEAETLFHEILEQAPGFVPALQGLAQQYLIQGRIGRVLAIRKRIEKIDPLAAVLGLAGEIQWDEAALEELERAARIPSLEGKVRSGFLFALASAYEKRREYAQAFEFARQANEAGKLYRAYDAKAHRNRCFRIRQRFSQALFDHRRGCGLASTLPVYVLGMPRSGTTLVEQILAGHPQIFGAGELSIIPQRIQGMNRWERHVGSGRSYPDCMDDLPPYISQGIAQGILDELQALAPGARHVVDKLPHNFEHIGFIKFLFPKARIISLRRDPRDIAVSNYFTDYMARQGGMGFAYDLGEIGEQLADHDRLMQHWHKLFPGQILEIRYEDVVDNLEKSARKLLDYVGVAWEPRVLAFHTLERPVKTASVRQVRKPIYKTSKKRWMNYKSHLSPLIRGTNGPILPDPGEDMITLPVPGLLQEGVALFRRGDLDGAERCFKKMLHHNPAHAAAAYMTGLVYCRKGYPAQGEKLMARAVEKAPWHKEWRQNLAMARGALGQEDDRQIINP